MEQTIPWIGYEYFANAVLYSIEERTGLKVSKFKWASDGLEGVLNKEFPVILVHDVVACGDPKVLPGSIAPTEYPKIAQHIIKTVKLSEFGKHTPVIAIGTFMDGYTPAKKYLEAGADKVINLMNTTPSQASNDIAMILGERRQ